MALGQEKDDRGLRTLSVSDAFPEGNAQERLSVNRLRGSTHCKDGTPEDNCALRKLAREEPDELSVLEVKNIEMMTQIPKKISFSNGYCIQGRPDSVSKGTQACKDIILEVG